MKLEINFNYYDEIKIKIVYLLEKKRFLLSTVENILNILHESS